MSGSAITTDPGRVTSTPFSMADDSCPSTGNGGTTSASRRSLSVAHPASTGHNAVSETVPLAPVSCASAAVAIASGTDVPRVTPGSSHSDNFLTQRVSAREKASLLSALLSGLPRRHAVAMIVCGRVRVNGLRCYDPRRALEPGDLVEAVEADGMVWTFGGGR